MKNAVSFLALALAFTALTAFTFSSKNNEYVGSQTCKACHSNPKTGGTAYKTWEKSVHANAYKTLQTAEADKIAKKEGHSTKAAETKECLSCHVTGHLEAGAKFGKKFDKAEGVGCESCHGAASAYRVKHAKDVEGARALGLITKKVDDGSAEKQCLTCHNEKSPTYRPLKFAEAWKKIAH
jgi:hypothetical protein